MEYMQRGDDASAYRSDRLPRLRTSISARRTRREHANSMPGLTGAYVSGYCESSAVRSDFTALGEFAVARTDGETAKGYNYAFGVSADGGVCYAGPFKDFPDHHWSSSEPIRIEKLFGHSAHYYGGSNSTRG